MLARDVPLSLALVACCIAAPNATNPCAQLTSQIFASTASDELVFLDPQLSFDCLKSSTIDTGLAGTFLDEYEKYLDFQTTLSYLKSPPPGYPYAPTDLIGGIQDIKQKLLSGGVQSQYDFEGAFVQLISSAHDGHLNPTTCLAGAVTFRRDVNLVSISADGVALPKIFVLESAITAKLNASALKLSQSNVVEINGEDVIQFLEKDALQTLSDPDSSFNGEMWNFGQELNNGSPLGSFTSPKFQTIYPGKNTTLTFANGTTQIFKTLASVTANDWSRDIIDGASLFRYFCVDAIQSQQQPTNTTTQQPATPTSTADPHLPTLPGYPYVPVTKDPNYNLAGYFLNGTAHTDVAVLHIGSFAEGQSGLSAEQAKSFQRTTRQFLAAAKVARKTKIIIDLTGNGGGNILTSYDLFARFFPSIEPYDTTRLRAKTASQLFIQALGETKNKSIQTTESSDWNFRTSLNQELQPFSSFNGSNGLLPAVLNNGDKFTALTRVDLNSSFGDIMTDFIVPYGFGNNNSTGPQPFETNQIVILTDGVCASSCSIFTEFMTRQAGVKTVVIGGRPRRQHIQAIGGTKGAQAETFDTLRDVSQEIMGANVLQGQSLALASATFPGINPMPFIAQSDLAKIQLNLRDNIAQDDPSATPLQFIFEPADCRIFYTAQSVTQPKYVWEHVADVMWGNKSCAVGDLNKPTLTPPGGPQSHGNGSVGTSALGTVGFTIVPTATAASSASTVVANSSSASGLATSSALASETASSPPTQTPSTVSGAGASHATAVVITIVLAAVVAAGFGVF
ncbi:MAG: hypothetical protein M1822_001783 [Bathelium mastoideum]|nr:MAG: hypothetical protein M1822_001783 [Bathelium mastoideum]